jgi:hypothetical protein
MISYAANRLAEISKSLSPIPSDNYVHCRMEEKGRVTLLMTEMTV